MDKPKRDTYEEIQTVIQCLYGVALFWQIRRDYVRGSRTHGQPALGRKYDLHQSTIGNIVRGEHWK